MGMQLARGLALNLERPRRLEQTTAVCTLQRWALLPHVTACEEPKSRHGHTAHAETAESKTHLPVLDTHARYLERRRSIAALCEQLQTQAASD